MVLEDWSEIDESYFEDIFVFVDVEETKDKLKKDLLILIHHILRLQLLLIRPLFLYQLSFFPFFYFFFLDNLVLLLSALGLFLLNHLAPSQILGFLLLGIVTFLDLILLAGFRFFLG